MKLIDMNYQIDEGPLILKNIESRYSFMESNRIEYKRDIPAKTSKMKAEVVSFLNSDPGGIIYLGMNDDGSLVEYKNDKEREKQHKKWEELLSNWIHTAFSPNVFGLIEIDPNRIPFEISIKAGPEKPYYFKDGQGMNFKGVFIREGSTKRRASDEEIFRMANQSKLTPYDLNETNNQKLMFTSLRDALDEVEEDFEPIRLRLKKTPNEPYNNAALIVSNQNETVSKLAVYSGLTTREFKDKKEFSGSIIDQIDSILNYAKLINSTSAVISGDAIRRESNSYPLEAIRESVVNAFAHRDYTLHADIRIEFYDNRVEVHSPGPIPEGLSVEDILDGSNARRNPTVVHILDKIRFMENFGSGIRRIYSLYAGFPREPGITATQNSFKFTLYNKNYLLNNLDSDDSRVSIVNFLMDGKRASRKEIQDVISIKKSGTIKLLNNLISENIIKTEGKSVATVYYLKG